MIMTGSTILVSIQYSYTTRTVFMEATFEIAKKMQNFLGDIRTIISLMLTRMLRSSTVRIGMRHTTCNRCGTCTC